MARLLNVRRLGAFITLTVVMLGVTLIGAGNTSRAQSQVSGWFTAYAFGNQIGASGSQVYNGDFANHTPAYCPGDPAASWRYGWQITLITPSTITEHSAGGATTYFGWLRLEDAGDLNCSQGNYWADVYHGRHKLSTEPCDCSGSPSPGYCENDYGGYTGNACTDALSFGHPWATYWSP
jgi:hypothetical protein